MADVPDVVTERWTDIGRRIGRDEKRYHVWLGPSGEERWFAKLPGAGVGTLHDVRIERQADGSLTAHGKPCYQGFLTTEQEPRRVEWQLVDDAADAAIERRRRERQAAGADPVVAALRPIWLAYRNARTRVQRDAILARVINIITQGEGIA